MLPPLLFSSKEIEDISQASGDNRNTFSSLSDYAPTNGWIKGNDGYFYYNVPVAPGESTPTLFTDIKTTFARSEDIQQHEIIVYAESVQVENYNGDTPIGFNYSTAWNEFLGRK